MKKPQLAKDPNRIDQIKNDSDEDDPDWTIKPIQELMDIPEGKLGCNYDWYYPKQEGGPKGTHVEDQQELIIPERTSDSPEFDSASKQLFPEQKLEIPNALTKPKAPEPRRSERLSRDTTNWQEQITQGLAGGINHVVHNDEHPTD